MLKGGMMKKTILWIMMIILMVSMIASFSLTGCKTNAAEETTAVEETTAAEEATAEETTAAEEVGIKPPEENVTIQLATWGFLDPQDTNWVKAYALFKEKYPTIDIEHVVAPFDDHMAYLKTTLLGGEGPDIWNSNIGTQMAQFSAYAENLEPWAEADWGENWKDLFVDTTIDWMLWANPDYVIALPMDLSSIWPLVYNKTMFDELGLVPPTNYDELLQVAETLKENGITPWACAGAEGWINEHLFQIIALQLGDGTAYNKAREGEISWTDPMLVTAMETFKKMYDDKLFGEDPFSVDFTTMNNNFFAGKAGMSHLGSWTVGSTLGTSLAEGRDPETVFALTGDLSFTGEPLEIRTVAWPGYNYSMNKDMDESKKNAAWIVLREIVNGVFAQYSADNISYFSAVKDITPNLGSLQLTPEKQDVIDTYKEYLSGTKYALPHRYPEINTAVWDNLNEVAIGIKTPIEALEALEEVSQNTVR